MVQNNLMSIFQFFLSVDAWFKMSFLENSFNSLGLFSLFENILTVFAALTSNF